MVAEIGLSHPAYATVLKSKLTGVVSIQNECHITSALLEW